MILKKIILSLLVKDAYVAVISADIAVTTKEEVWSKTQELNGFHKYILTIRELFGALFYCLFLR